MWTSTESHTPFEGKHLPEFVDNKLRCVVCNEVRKHRGLPLNQYRHESRIKCSTCKVHLRTVIVFIPDTDQNYRWGPGDMLPHDYNDECEQRSRSATRQNGLRDLIQRMQTSLQSIIGDI